MVDWLSRSSTFLFIPLFFVIPPSKQNTEAQQRRERESLHTFPLHICRIFVHVFVVVGRGREAEVKVEVRTGTVEGGGNVRVMLGDDDYIQDGKYRK